MLNVIVFRNFFEVDTRNEPNKKIGFLLVAKPKLWTRKDVFKKQIKEKWQKK